MLIERELCQLRLLEAASHRLVRVLNGVDWSDPETKKTIQMMDDCMQDYENERRVPPRRMRPTVSAALFMLLGNFLLAFAHRSMRGHMTEEQAERFCLLAEAVDSDKRWGA